VNRRTGKLTIVLTFAEYVAYKNHQIIA